MTHRKTVLQDVDGVLTDFCSLQCEDSLIDSVHSLPISHGVKAYSPQSNSSYTSGSESLDPLSADQPQAAQEALPVVKQVVKSEEVQYTAEHAKMAIERACVLRIPLL